MPSRNLPSSRVRSCDGRDSEWLLMKGCAPLISLDERRKRMPVERNKRSEGEIWDDCYQEQVRRSLWRARIEIMSG